MDCWTGASSPCKLTFIPQCKEAWMEGKAQLKHCIILRIFSRALIVNGLQPLKHWCGPQQRFVKQRVLNCLFTVLLGTMIWMAQVKKWIKQKNILNVIINGRTPVAKQYKIKESSHASNKHFSCSFGNYRSPANRSHKLCRHLYIYCRPHWSPQYQSRHTKAHLFDWND